MAEKCKISLVLADVDGTLVTEEKVLTKRAQNAVSALQRLRPICAEHCLHPVIEVDGVENVATAAQAAADISIFSYPPGGSSSMRRRRSSAY